MKQLILLALFLLPTIAHTAPKKELWVYTSIYKEFAAPIKAAFEAKHPDVEIQIFQGGSEKIQAKVEAELVAKAPQADVILTSDPFWSQELDRRGLLRTRKGHGTTDTNYYSLMVMIAHKDFAAEKRPHSFEELGKPEYKNLIQSGSPLDSGTTFSTVAYLSDKYGWGYFEKLRDNRLASSGGNSTVIQKVESGEKKLGIVLLENALAARKRGSPIEIIYPKDGSIPIPSVQVILKSTKSEKDADEFADFLLTKEGQELMRNGYMYSVRKDVGPPEGGEPFAEVTRNSTPWTPERLQKVGAAAKDIKKKFSALILE